tara:strand:- start:116887 stop:117291 length:405 start_codon:yes stop_codon:yes gene_type:complete
MSQETLDEDFASLIPADTPALDESHLEILIEASGDAAKDLFEDLLGTFKEDGKALTETLQEACQKEDATTCRKSLHTLAGSSANIGCQRLAKLCRAMETAIDDGTFKSYSSCPSLVDAEFQTAAGALQAFVDKL